MARPRPILPMHTCALLVICCLLGACASSQQQSASASPPVSAQEQVTAESSSQTLTVESSHGVQEIQPTVVGYTAPPSNTDDAAQASDQAADFGDPLEFINRPVFAFNDVLYSYLLIPVSHGYKKIMPDLVQTGVSNFFANIREPINGINNLLQGKGSSLANNLSRFVINSTLGILGLFDPAKAWFEIDSQVAHIDDTLRSYDVGYGSFIVIPFLGQSDLRNGFSILVESLASPIRQVTDDPQTLYLQSYEGYHGSVPKLLSYEDLRKDKDDRYVFFRNLYMQSVLRDQQFPMHEEIQPEVKQHKGPEQDKSGSDPEQQDSREQP